MSVCDRQQYLSTSLTADMNNVSRLFGMPSTDTKNERRTKGRRKGKERPLAAFAAANVFQQALDDNSWLIKMRALEKVNLTDNIVLKRKVASIAKNDQHSNVRAAAIEALAATGDKTFIPEIDVEAPFFILSNHSTVPRSYEVR